MPRSSTVSAGTGEYEMKTRILVAAVGLPLLLAVIFLTPGWCFAAMLACFCAIGAFELMRAVQPKLPKWLFAVTGLAAFFTAIGVCWGKRETFAAVSAVSMLFVTSAAAIRDYGREGRVGHEAVFAAVFGSALIPFCLSALSALRLEENGRALVLLPFVLAFMSDGGAYFVGRAVGKRKAFPNVSPHKTVEGCIGSFLSGMAGMLIYGLILVLLSDFSVSFASLLLYGAVGNLSCQLGDLAFSLIKRERAVKDYGTLLPGHGGVLDRLDSMIFVAPILYAAVRIFPAI